MNRLRNLILWAALLLLLPGCQSSPAKTEPPAPEVSELSVPAAPAEALTIPPAEEPANLRCRLEPDGRLLCWDEIGETDGWRLQLPEGTNIPLSDTPALLAENVVAAAVGRAHVIFLKGDGSVWTFGENFAGQIGNGTAGTRETTTPAIPTSQLPPPDPNNYALEPVQVLADCVAVAAGNSVCAALGADGTLYTWGDNSCGQIGNGERGNGLPTISDLYVSTPQPILQNVTALTFCPAAGGFEATAADGTCFRWGGDFPDTPTT